MVRYDDLRTRTLDTMRDLCAALELPVTEQRLAQVVDKHAFENIPQRERGEGKFYRKATSGGWKDDLTPEQAKIVEDITAPLINEFS
jgi:hypothetical protein